MNDDQILHGHLYAISAVSDLPFSIEPYLCVQTPIGKRFIHSMMLRLDTAHDGPHHVTEEAVDFASRHGWKLDTDDIWSLWSQREKAESFEMATAAMLQIEAEHPAVAEAQRILIENGTPHGQAATWLRNSEQWPGSSLDVLYTDTGALSGAFVSIYTNNPYKLRSLLRWLGLPKSIVMKVTGLER